MVCKTFINLIGTPCDDGDACTTGDVYTSNCTCEGTYTDSDQDGVCDANDICQGGDDNIDSNQNGVPDYCECAPGLGQFPENPLTHAGAGSNSTTYNFPPNSKQVSFSVFNINETTRLFYSYDEKVDITYVDAAGTTQLYGTYLGSQVSTANVDISGFVQSVTVSLENALDENTNLPMSVSMSDIDYCVETLNLQESPQAANALTEQNMLRATKPMDFSVWPNPAKNEASISFSRIPKAGSEVLVKNSLGQDIARYQLGTAQQYKLAPKEWNTQNRLVWVVLLEPGCKPVVKRLVVIR